jgi:hypothetical protein
VPRIELICDLVSKGATEQAACIRAGISTTAWCKEKRADASLRERVSEARDSWARLKHKQYEAARQESQIARGAGQKAIPPRPTKQAKWVCRYLAVDGPAKSSRYSTSRNRGGLLKRQPESGELATTRASVWVAQEGL